jgi:hypothetical protein
VIDEAKINPNIDELHQYFNTILGKYFENGKPVPAYFEGVPCYNCGMLFSVRGFEEMLQDTGFKPVKIHSNGFDISTLNRIEMGKHSRSFSGQYHPGFS